MFRLVGAVIGAAGVYQGGVGSNDKEVHVVTVQAVEMVVPQSLYFPCFEWVSIDPPGQIFH